MKKRIIGMAILSTVLQSGCHDDDTSVDPVRPFQTAYYSSGENREDSIYYQEDSQGPHIYRSVTTEAFDHPDLW